MYLYRSAMYAHHLFCFTLLINYHAVLCLAWTPSWGLSVAVHGCSPSTLVLKSSSLANLRCVRTASGRAIALLAAAVDVVPSCIWTSRHLSLCCTSRLATRSAHVHLLASLNVVVSSSSTDVNNGRHDLVCELYQDQHFFEAFSGFSTLFNNYMRCI
jgi:lambda repressor-like predicted transcriptional regulator